MNFSDIRIVLVATSHPGNIGSTARAMKTMGFNHLYLVTPKEFPSPKAYEMAAGADSVLDDVIVTATIEEAVSNCQLVLATSARPRGIGLPGLTPSACAELVAKQPENTKVAILFGREHAGLTNDELLYSHYHINIPSNPEYGSLNLAQAVQIIVYELRMKLLSPKALVELREEPLATMDEVELFYQHLNDVMVEIEFLKPNNPRRLTHRIRRLFNRAQLEHMEVNILRGILTQIQKLIRKTKHQIGV